MKNKYYTAERHEDDRVLVYLPGAEYILALDFARKLRDSITVALGEADLSHKVAEAAARYWASDDGDAEFDAQAFFVLDDAVREYRAAVESAPIVRETGE